MIELPEAAREVLESSRLAHMVTLSPDGSPQVSCVWVGLEAGEIVVASLPRNQKVRNVERDPRVAISVGSDEVDGMGLDQYLVIHGTARVTLGGAPELLQRLAHGYLGEDVQFPPMDNPPPGHIIRIAPQRIGGNGPWMRR